MDTPGLHPVSGLYPPCAECGSGGHPADFMAEARDGRERPFCVDCLVRVTAEAGRLDLAASIGGQRTEVERLRRTPGSLSFRA